MANDRLPPVPPLTQAGFQDPVWVKWLQLLRQQVAQAVTVANLTFTAGNGFTGSFTPSGGNVTLTIGTSVIGIMKGNGTSATAAIAGTDYVQTVSVTAPITNAGTAANPNISHAASGVGAGTYTKVTVNATGHVTVGALINSSDVTTALGFTPANVANPLSQFAATTSAQLRGVLTDETGTGVAVFNLNPAITAPVISGGGTIDGIVIGSITPGPVHASTLDSTSTLALTSYSPTVTAASGTFTTVAATGSYSQIGKLTFFRATVTITTNGTAAGAVRVTLPFTATSTATGTVVVNGRQDAVGGGMLQGTIISGGTFVQLVTYNNLYPGSSGETVLVSGWYMAV